MLNMTYTIKCKPRHVLSNVKHDMYYQM